MVEEARAYVQGESLKARAALLREVFKLPDHQGEIGMRISLAAVVALALTSAANADPASDLQAWRSICAQQVRQGIIKTAFAMEDCDNRGMRRYLAAVNFPWMDLQDTNEAEHIANGDNFDNQKITLQELIAADNRVDSEFTTAVNQRVAIAQQQSLAQDEGQRRLACQSAALGQPGPFVNSGGNVARCQAGLPPISAPTPMPMMPLMPPPIHTYCQTIENQTYCTTQ